MIVKNIFFCPLALKMKCTGINYFVCVNLCPSRVVLCFFSFCMVSVSLDCPILIFPSSFSNVYMTQLGKFVSPYSFPVVVKYYSPLFLHNFSHCWTFPRPEYERIICFRNWNDQGMLYTSTQIINLILLDRSTIKIKHQIM